MVSFVSNIFEHIVVSKYKDWFSIHSRQYREYYLVQANNPFRRVNQRIISGAIKGDIIYFNFYSVHLLTSNNFISF